MTTDRIPDISVVVPGYLGARTVADCLDSIHHAIRGRDAEVIVVESSGDGAAEIVQQRFPNVKVVQSSTRLSAGGARNRGTAESRGKIVFFTDQDCIVPPDWISRLEGHLARPGVGAAGGSTTNRPTRKSAEDSASCFTPFQAPCSRNARELSA